LSNAYAFSYRGFHAKQKGRQALGLGGQISAGHALTASWLGSHG